MAFQLIHAGGRPSQYNEALAIEICELVASGLSIRKICQRDGFPSRPTVMRWLSFYPQFRQAYGMAKMCLLEDMVDECLEIADDSSGDKVNSGDPDAPHVIVNREALGRSQLRLNERHYWLDRLWPERYGDLAKLPIPDGEGARLVNAPKAPLLIEHHPLYESILAWEAAEKAARGVPEPETK